MMTLVYCCILTDDYTQLIEKSRDPENGNLFMLLTSISGVFGIVITLSVLCVVATGGPIAVNITGTFKDVFLTYVGFTFFDDQKFSPLVAIGLGLSFIGAIVWVKF